MVLCMSVRTAMLVAVAILAFAAGGRAAPAATNDLREHAVPILQAPFVHSLDTSSYNASPFASDPPMECGSPEDDAKQSHTAWYRIQPVTSGTLTATTAGSSYDTVVALWTTTGGGAPASMLACNDNQANPGKTSRIPDGNDSTSLIAGNVYLLEVASYHRTDGGQLELAVTYTGQVAPVVSTLTPPGAVAGSGAVQVAIAGSGFLAGSSVTANNQALTAVVQGPGSITATLPAGLTNGAGEVSIRVMAPSGALSNPATFTVIGAPTITGVTPRVIEAGSGAKQVMLAGAGFVDGLTHAIVNGNERDVAVAAGSAAVSVLAADTMNPGWLGIVLENRLEGAGSAASEEVLVLVRHPLDAQCDGEVSSADVLALLRAAAGLVGWEAWCPGGEATLAGAVEVARLVAGLEP